MTINPLVVPRLEGPKDPWSGVWIAEDIELIAQGVDSGNWVDITLGGVSAGLDALALVSDPLGALAQYGVSWLIEHVRPLTEALDALAGDPGQVAGQAATWRNAATALATDADDLAVAVNTGTASWSGAAADAYRQHADGQRQALLSLARASQVLAAIVEGAGYLVAGVRTLVRDAIATLASRLVSYAAEEGLTLGWATPLVAEQVATTVLAWGARIAKWLRALLSSLRNLVPMVRRLGDLIDALRRILRRDKPATPEAPPPPRPAVHDPAAEEKRVHDLGWDPAVGKYRPGEAATALRIEQERGVHLKRAPRGASYDWYDAQGRTYDAVGNFPSQFFDKQWPSLKRRMGDHLDKAEFVPVDVSSFTSEQRAEVRKFIENSKFGSRIFILGDN